MQVNPYLNFPGTTEEAFNFYKSIFGGEFITLQRFSDMGEANPVPEEIKNKILHIALPLGTGNILMATDAIESMGPKLDYGNNMHLSLNTDSREENERIFTALSEGGKVTMPLADMFWGDYFGMCTDKFGIHWMLSFNKSHAAS